MSIRRILGLSVLALSMNFATAQDINRPISDDPSLVEVPRKVGDQGYGAGGIQDSVLSGGGPSPLPGSSVVMPNPCDYDPQRCVLPDTGSPGSGGGSNGTQIYGTCAFSGTGGTSQAQRTQNGSCSQYGNFVGVTSSRVRAVFVVGDTTTGSGNTFSTKLSDPGKYAISWSGACGGNGPTCQTELQTVDWRGAGASWSASYTVTEYATGRVFNGSMNATYAPCGAVVGSRSYECP